MLGTRIFLVGLFLILSNDKFALTQDTKPSGLVVLKKGAMRMWLSVPGDSVNYRGTRFDHSGMIQKIQVGDHQLCERWHTGPSNPDANDDVTGPCEEFGNAKPLGYLPSRPGATFIKIGVGVLRQPEETEYRFSNAYEFVRRGEWTTENDSSSITYRQRLQDESAGNKIGYEYQKSIRLTDSGFRIEHQLKNVGADSWTTDHYNHNFFLIDSDKVGPNYEVQFPFSISPVRRQESFNEIVNVVDKTIRFKELVGTRSFFAELSGHSNKVSDHQFQLKHIPSGVTIECKGSSPLSKMNFWGMGSTICPEPYSQINLAPNEQYEWVLDYVITTVASN